MRLKILPLRLALALSAGIALPSLQAHAANFQETVAKVVITNPDVRAKWHLFKAGTAERDVSFGRYLPTLDLIYGVGDERRETPVTPLTEYHIKNSKITLRQNLFEGFATRNDVLRLEHASRVRFYELLDASETAAFEATKAYIDLYRYRRLLEMAEENYAVHRIAYEKINERAKSGVGRGVDLETAGGRLALAESNLLTEASNLHDVNARFQRIVGNQPPADIDPPPTQFASFLPKTREEAVISGFKTSPQLKAAVDNILSAQRNVAVQRGGYYPRVDAYMESSREKNLSGSIGNTKVDTLGVTMTVNLFRGRQDSSRTERAVQETSVAKDVRERVCRDLRQNLSTSFNDHLRLIEQLPFLDQHQLSTDKAREALRKQFDIGQRTLLDVLDTENEFYTARRNYLNGEMDLAITQAKYLASSGTLLAALKLSPLQADPPTPDTELDEDAANHCPPEPAPHFQRAKPKADSYAVLLNNPDGSTGKIVMSGSKGEQWVDKAGFGVPTDGSAAPAPVPEDKLKRDFGAAMSARPPLPESFLFYFVSGTSKLTRESTNMIPKLVENISSRPAPEVTILGYGDTVGSVKINDALGLKRANAVAAQLKARKVPVQSLQVESRGKRELLVNTPDKTPEPRNRAAKVLVR